jgi:apolipoprotein N-acyltransferase
MLGGGVGYVAATLWATAFFAPHFHFAAVSAGTTEWLLLVAASALLWGLIGPAWAGIRKLIKQHPGATPWLFALVFVGMEQLRAVFPYGGFPWGRLAFSQASAPTAHLAYLGGAPLVSLACALGGGLLFAAAHHLVQGRTWRCVGVACLLLAVILGPGLINLPSDSQDGQLRLGAVQGNVPHDPNLSISQERRQVLENHLMGHQRLLDKAGNQKLDLVIWPEDSVDNDPQTTPAEAALIAEAAKNSGTALLIGSQEYPASGGRYNVSLLFDGEQIIGRYAKRHPVPFGEYLPLRSLAKLVSRNSSAIVTDMLPGDQVGLLKAPVARLGENINLGVVICFEVAYDSLVSDTINAGAQLLIVQTNNASFGTSDQSVQHLAMSRLRAIEHGRSVVHISTTGQSALISPSGVLLDQSEYWQPAELIANLPLRHSKTWGTRLSGPLGWFCGTATALLAAIRVVSALGKRRKESK